MPDLADELAQLAAARGMSPDQAYAARLFAEQAIPGATSPEPQGRAGPNSPQRSIMEEVAPFLQMAMLQRESGQRSRETGLRAATDLMKMQQQGDLSKAQLGFEQDRSNREQERSEREGKLQEFELAGGAVGLKENEAVKLDTAIQGVDDWDQGKDYVAKLVAQVTDPVMLERAMQTVREYHGESEAEEVKNLAFPGTLAAAASPAEGLGTEEGFTSWLSNVAEGGSPAMSEVPSVTSQWQEHQEGQEPEGAMDKILAAAGYLGAGAVDAFDSAAGGLRSMVTGEPFEDAIAAKLHRKRNVAR
jgi:hypothetical protein